jgi:hypothetical protein
MSATNAFETDLLELIFNNTNIANIGDVTGLRGASSAGNLYISLHTADPGETGDQETSEATYTSYARVAVSRDSGEWAVSGNNVSNVNAIQFPTSTGGNNTITHFGIGTASSGAGNLLFKGALTTTIGVSTGIQPTFAVGELDVNVD